MEFEKRNNPELDMVTIKFKRWELVIFWTLIGFILFGPYLFTRNSLLGFSFEETGQIGDTIGGITAPFVNLLAAFLVYKSFFAQINANYIQQKNHREQLEAQKKNHDQQISIILNEQSSNLLLSLFDRIYDDYISNEKKHRDSGWANELNNGLQTLYKFSSPQYDDFKDRQAHLKNGATQINHSIGKVNFVYGNLLQFLDLISKSLLETKDDSVKIVVRYTCVKISNIFHSNNYSSILAYDIENFAERIPISESMDLQLKITYQSALSIRNKIDDIFLELDGQIPNALSF